MNMSDVINFEITTDYTFVMRIYKFPLWKPKSGFESQLFPLLEQIAHTVSFISAESGCTCVHIS